MDLISVHQNKQYG